MGTCTLEVSEIFENKNHPTISAVTATTATTTTRTSTIQTSIGAAQKGEESLTTKRGV